ncbi:hypothetical protein [Falsiroseomonas sp. HW251]|uniref:hypothetical protein n=1 Tax=Falsiroseomonas sp. HW251 TaxID=3390998 RepID=UPI003D3107CD
MVGRVAIGILIVISVALIGFYGLFGSLSSAIGSVYPRFGIVVSTVTEETISKTFYVAIVRPLVEAPAWIYPLLAAALIQLNQRLRARDVG